MTTDALDKALDTIRAEKDVIGIRDGRTLPLPYIIVIADAEWRPEIKENDDYFLLGESALLKVRITEALKPHGYVFRGQDVNVFTGDDAIGIIEWLFVGARA